MNTIITLLVIALLASTDSATELCVVPYSHSACPCPTSTCHVFDYYHDSTLFLTRPSCSLKELTLYMVHTTDLMSQD